MNKRLGHSVVAAAAAMLLLAGTAAAAELRYDYAELRYVDAEIDGNGGGDLNGDGFEFGGSLEIADNIHLFGSYQALDFDGNVDTSALELGAGYMVPVAPSADLVARISYIDGEVDAGFANVDDSGIGLSAGFRKLFTSQFEGRAFINHVDLDESGNSTSVELAGDYYFNPQFAAGLSLEFGDDETAIGIGGRYFFGRSVR
ncbi:MAG TPA: outer membrane beta-barrel protein [Woeseiaceae bacterium]|nr:outer membrane beta-barrel protein [Woeseiaceae bacterium]